MIFTKCAIRMLKCNKNIKRSCAWIHMYICGLAARGGRWQICNAFGCCCCAALINKFELWKCENVACCHLFDSDGSNKQPQTSAVLGARFYLDDTLRSTVFRFEACARVTLICYSYNFFREYFIGIQNTVNTTLYAAIEMQLCKIYNILQYYIVYINKIWN